MCSVCDTLIPHFHSAFSDCMCGLFAKSCYACMNCFLFAKWCAIKGGETPVHAAAYNGHLEVIKYLVTEAKADVNQPSKVWSGVYDVWDHGAIVCV